MNQLDDYLSVSAAAKLLGVSRQWLQRLVAAERVPGAAVLAGHRVFARAEFAPWARQQVERRSRKRVNPS